MTRVGELIRSSKRDPVVPGAPRRRGVVPLLVAAPAAVAALLVLDWCLALLRPGTRTQVWLWTTVTTGAPLWFGAVLLVAMVAVTLLLTADSRCPVLLVDALITAECAAYFFSTRVSPMTGDAPALLAQAGKPDVWVSEALADAVHKIAFQVGGAPAVRYVGPLFGVAAAAAWLFLARRIAERWAVPLPLARGFLLATPLTFWFLVDYTENTFLALPFLIASIGVLLGPRKRGGRLAAGALLGAAVSMHGMNLVMVVAVLVAVVLEDAPLARRLRDGAVLLAAVVTVCASVLVGCLAAGLRFNAYNMTGGYDRTMWVPFEPVGYLFRFTFLSHAHLIELADIAVHAAPLLVLALPVLLIRRRRTLRTVAASAGRDDGLVLLALMSSGYLVFAAVWGFDYGTVGDLDLMLVMDVPFAVYLLVVVHRLVRGRWALHGLIVGSALCNLAYYSYKVSLIWWPLS